MEGFYWPCMFLQRCRKAQTYALLITHNKSSQRVSGLPPKKNRTASQLHYLLNFNTSESLPYCESLFNLQKMTYPSSFQNPIHL